MSEPHTAAARAAFSSSGAPFWEPWWQDARHAARGLRRKPLFTVAVILTLGLGIGANATMFGIVDRLLFRPPAFLIAPERVHRPYLATTDEREGERAFGGMSYKRYLEFTEWTRTAERTAAFASRQLPLGTGDATHEARVGAVSASFWGFFDARPALGRFFTADEDRTPNGTAVVVLGHAYWQTRLGGRPDVIGETITIGSTAYTIIGVAPRGFTGVGLQPPAAFIPITAYAGNEMMGGFFRARPGGRPQPTYYEGHNITWMQMLVRRAPGIAPAAMERELTSAYRRSWLAQAETQPSLAPIEVRKPRVLVAPVQAERGPNTGQDTKVATWLVGVAGIVLLIACANVGNLLLARAFGRRREIAVRLALGVGRGRLLRQLLTESLLLALLGAMAGLLIAQWGGGIVRTLLLADVSTVNALTDGRVLLFAAAVALLTGILTGLAPALYAGRSDLSTALRSGVREGTYHRSRLRVALLVVQGALSVVLLVGAGLFVRSLNNVQSLDLGYDPQPVLYVEPRWRGVRLEEDARVALQDRLEARAQSLPVVQHAARAMAVPFWMSINNDLFVAGIDSVSRLGSFYYHAVAPDYFATMGTRLVRGRGIERGDTKEAPRVMVVSESMARTLWPGQEALGRCVRINADTMPCTNVVGIVQDIKRESLSEETGLQYYVPIKQASEGFGGLFIRTRAADAVPLAETIRKALQVEMPGVSYVDVTPLAEIVAPEMRSWKLGATMFTVFGGLALALAAIGLYSVIAYNVAQRTHELGVRVALGAQARDLVRLVVTEGLRLAVVGVAVGGAIALLAGRWVGPLLFDVKATDPTVFATVAVVLLGVAVLASLLPSVRAARVDPSRALRGE